MRFYVVSITLSPAVDFSVSTSTNLRHDIQISNTFLLILFQYNYWYFFKTSIESDMIPFIYSAISLKKLCCNTMLILIKRSTSTICLLKI